MQSSQFCGLTVSGFLRRVFAVMRTESDENTDENRTDKEPAAALSAAAEQIRRKEKENTNAMFQIEWKGRSAWLEAVVFDMDGLMFDSERVVMYSWDEAGKQMGYGPLGHNIYHTLGMGAESRERYFKKTYGADFPYEQFKQLYRDAFYNYADEEGIPLKPGLRELLDFLKEQRIPAAMATSTGSSDVKKRLDREGLEPYFQVIITGDMVKETKPSPEIYEKACRALGADPARTIALEDACNGIRSAYGAGMLPIMVPDLQKDFSEVENMLSGKMGSLTEVRRWLEDCCLHVTV